MMWHRAMTWMFRSSGAFDDPNPGGDAAWGRTNLPKQKQTWVGSIHHLSIRRAPYKGFRQSSEGNF